MEKKKKADSHDPCKDFDAGLRHLREERLPMPEEVRKRIQETHEKLGVKTKERW